MDQLNVLVAENDPLFRAQIQESVLAFFPMSKFFHANNSNEVFNLLLLNRIDLIFLDFQIIGLDGIESTRKIRGTGNSVKIILTTTEGDRTHVMRMIRAGVNGYVFKSIDPSKLENAIESVLDGRFYFSEGTPESKNQKTGIQTFRSTKSSEVLSAIEIELLVLICEQKNLSEIMKLTNMDEVTINSHVLSIMKKTHTSNLIGLALYAVRNGYINSDQIK